MRHPATLLIVAGALAAACGGESAVNTTTPSEPWALEDVQIDAGGGVRVLVVHDMEGLAGQDDPLTFEFGSELYSHGQDLLVGDVNAVIDGLYAGGATEVQVVDGHGSENPGLSRPSEDHKRCTTGIPQRLQRTAASASEHR